MEIALLFPVPVGIVEYVNLPDIDFNKIKWRKCINMEPYKNISDISEDTNVLKEYPDLKREIGFHVKDYIEKYSMGDKQEFQIVTSWFTRSKPNTESNAHSHSNCWLSGVIHFSDNGGCLKFEKDMDSFSPALRKSNTNPYNTGAWDFPVKKSKMFIFPATLKHKIMLNTTRHNRYSMAFNILPKGEFGAGDSKFNWPEFNS